MLGVIAKIKVEWEEMNIAGKFAIVTGGLLLTAALVKKGVMKELEDLCLKDGDTVIVHNFEFDYVK